MIRNLRDIGGLTGADGRKIKKGMFFRSALLNELEDEDIKWMKESNITRVYDLRTPGEAKRRPDIIVDGIEDINYSLQNEQSGLTAKGLRALLVSAKTEYERMQYVPKMEDIYKSFVIDEYTRDRFGKLIYEIVHYDKGSILVHCTSGKDRTGMTAAIICSLLGVSLEDIFEDYLRSLEHAEWEAKIMRKQFIDEGASEDLADQLKEFFLLDRRYLETFFGQMSVHFGSIDNYINEVIGLSDKEIISFREKMLE